MMVGIVVAGDESMDSVVVVGIGFSVDDGEFSLGCRF